MHIKGCHIQDINAPVHPQLTLLISVLMFSGEMLSLDYAYLMLLRRG
uniref:Uncharacterized protein n=1 Tax=Arundo donax TaxID=35708 RepID=A0A0A9GHP8_ARUDO